MEFSEKNRKKVIVLNFGNPNNYKTLEVRNKDNLLFITDGYTINAFAHGVEWIGMIRIINGNDEYIFYKKNEDISKYKWCSSPTAAFKDSYEMIKCQKLPEGVNGRLIIGITYPAIQRQIYENILPFINK